MNPTATFFGMALIITCSNSLAGGANIPDHHHTPAYAPSPSHHDVVVEPCSVMEMELFDCVSFIAAGSSDTAPNRGCCKGLEGVLKKNHTCVCVALKDSGDMGIAVDFSRAAVLAELCHLKAPPVSDCHLSSSPPSEGPTAPTPVITPSPQSSPAPPPPSSSKEAPAPSESSSVSALPQSLISIIAVFAAGLVAW